MDYLQVEAGEIFLAAEDGQSLMLALHRGDPADAFWTKERFEMGEGFIGIAAETGKPVVYHLPQRRYPLPAPGRGEAGFPLHSLHTMGGPRFGDRRDGYCHPQRMPPGPA